MWKHWKHFFPNVVKKLKFSQFQGFLCVKNVQKKKFILVLIVLYLGCISKYPDSVRIQEYTDLEKTAPLDNFTAQKMKFSTKDFFSTCDQIRSFLVPLKTSENHRFSTCDQIHSFLVPLKTSENQRCMFSGGIKSCVFVHMR